MAEPIKDTSGGLGAILQLLGQQGSTNTSGQTLAQQIQSALTNGSTTGTTSGTSAATTTNTAQLAPLIQAFSQASQGMSPEMLTQLISSIFTEGAQQIPALTQQFANATGSRTSGNSGLQLALGDLNRNMSTQAVQALLNYNQGQSQTAANTAAQIAANTRQTNQTGQQQQQTANTTQQSQQQTGTTNTTQQQQQGTKSGVNSSMAGLVGLGGTALNFLDKKGVFDKLFGRDTPTPTIGTGTLPAASPVTLTNGGGAGMLSTPAASQGFLQGPVAANPYGYSAPTAGGGLTAGTNAPAVSVPSFSPAGITGLGGFGSTPSGGIGLPGNVGFGSLPTGFDAFGTAGTGSLGSNLDFGSNPYGYAGSADGITGAVGGAGTGGDMFGNFTGGFNDLMGGLGSGLSDFGSSLGNLFGGATDWLGSFFANGGMIGPTARPQLGYADGGQVQTGGVPTRTRNVNYLGPRIPRSQSEALNYEGYAPSAAPVGSQQPAGLSPSLGLAGQTALLPAPAQGPVSAAQTAGNSNQQAIDLFRESVARAQAASDAAAIARGTAGGSGGVGEGGAPGQNEADNGAAGIGPSGIAAAPTGTSQAVGLAAGLTGFMTPPVNPLALIAAIAAAVNAANQAQLTAQQAAFAPDASPGGPGGVSSAPSDDSPDIGVTVSVPGLPGISTNSGGGGGTEGGTGTAGGPGSGSAGGPGDSGVGGDSAGDGTSGSAGTSAGGDNWKNGGLVRGAGTGTSDSIRVKSRDAGGKDINYSDGEYVIPADVVQALGVQHFDNILDAFHART